MFKQPPLAHDGYSFKEEFIAMTNARMIEYRITRRLLQRRELAPRRWHAGGVIKAVAVFAGLTLLSLCLPQVLFAIFLASLVITFGL